MPPSKRGARRERAGSTPAPGTSDDIGHVGVGTALAPFYLGKWSVGVPLAPSHAARDRPSREKQRRTCPSHVRRAAGRVAPITCSFAPLSGRTAGRPSSPPTRLCPSPAHGDADLVVAG